MWKVDDQREVSAVKKRGVGLYEVRILRQANTPDW